MILHFKTDVPTAHLANACAALAAMRLIEQAQLAPRAKPMRTSAQIAIQTGPDGWQHCVHFDGDPHHMPAALIPWQPADILAARVALGIGRAAVGIRSPRAPQIEAKPTRAIKYLYGWCGGGWADMPEQSSIP